MSEEARYRVPQDRHRPYRPGEARKLPPAIPRLQAKREPHKYHPACQCFDCRASRLRLR